MLCYRCGSYNADDARKCSICEAPLSAPRKKNGNRTSSGRRGTGRAPYDNGGIVAKRYRIVDPVGQGTAGWVLRARDEEVDIDVALKLVSPNLLQTEQERSAFVKALRAAKKVQHPNVVRIYDEGRDGDQIYYTMPFLEGLTLRKIIDLRVDKKQVFSFSEVLPLVSQLAQALDAWGKFKFHGAIRPSSIVVLPDVLKITGLAHLQGLPRLPFSVLQKQAGNELYLAPEARKDEGGLDKRADIYSTAVIFGEMVTGVTFGGDDRKWSRVEAELPKELTPVLRKALSEAPEDRYESGHAFFEALAEALTGYEGATSSPGVPVEMFDDEASGVDEVPAPPSLSGPSFRPPPINVIPTPPKANRVRERRGAPGGRRFASVVAIASVLILAGVAIAGARWYNFFQQQKDDAPSELVVEESVPLAVLEAEPGAGAPSLDVSESETEAAAVDIPQERVVEPALEPSPKDTPEAARPAQKPRSGAGEKPAAKQESRSKEKAVALLQQTPERIATKEPPPTPPEPPKDGDPVHKTCPEDMVEIGGGRFLMGTQSNDPMRGFADLQVRYRNTQRYCIDVYEYPNQPGKLPVTAVSWAKAKRSCEALGKRLCSEVEWERACKGPGNARFPFGNAVRKGACNVEDGGRPKTAGSYDSCVSGYGVNDMSGNVAEWTASRWSAEISDRVVKGGAADQAIHASRCSARINEASGARDDALGFRCCVSLD